MNKKPSISYRGKTSTIRKALFGKKEEFHQMQARLPFDEKIRILVELQKIAKNIKKKKDVFVWQI